MARRSLSTTITVFVTLVMLAACTELKVAGVGATDDGGDTPAEEEDAEGADAGKDGASPKDAGKDAKGVDSGTKDGGPPPPSCDGPCPPEELVTGIGAKVLTVDATNIYFGNGAGSNGMVYQCPKTGCGGAPIELGEGYASGIAVVGGVVYWGDYAAGKLVSCAVGGCGKLPTTVVSNQPGIHGVFTDGDDLFWETNGTIRHCPRATCSGATAADIATGQKFGSTIAIDQGKVFWAEPYDDQVHQCPVGPCPSPTVFGTGVLDVSIHAGFVYWVTRADNVVRCALGGCSQTPTTIGSSTSPRFPVADATHVYWRDHLSYRIFRCPTSGCVAGTETLATWESNDGQIALDGEYVYWARSDGVARLHK